MKRTAAFSLVEIMIAVSLMSVIVIGLMAMFTQTQRAFRLGMNQTDVLEAGRMATDMMVREMEQITPSRTAAPAFYSELYDSKNIGRQKLPGSGSMRTNLMTDVFFLTRENQTMKGVGYFVRTDNTVPNSFAPVGTLYRYETNNPMSDFGRIPFGLWMGFMSASQSGVDLNVSKIMDGVVHFQVRAYDINGLWINNDVNSDVSRFVQTNASWWSSVIDNYACYRFTNNLAPAFVELEIGVLENDSYQRYKALPPGPVKGNYYTNHAGNVHVFRQRIPIRNVDVTAYQ